MIVGGKIITASQVGARLEQLVCEKCRTMYFYDLVRIGSGSGSAPYLLFHDAARNRAERAAVKDLGKRLDREAEMVPCPKCNWVNVALVERYRKRQYRRAWSLIGGVITGGFVLSIMAMGAISEMQGRPSRTPVYVMLAILALSLTSPAWVLLMRARLRSRIDPNATWPRVPALPTGTPPALVLKTDPQAGEQYYEVLGREETEAGDEWAIFRPGQMELPKVCGVCLGDATTVYRSPFRVSDNDADVALPLCGPCADALRGRWWRLALASVAAALLLGTLLFFVLGFAGGDDVGRWWVSVMIAVFAALAGVAIVPNRICRPYKLKVVDADRGVFKFKATSAQYTQLLIEQVREEEGR